MTDLQSTILKQSARNGGRFVSGKLLVSVRKLQVEGLVTIEDMGTVRGRGMNAERWLVKATARGLLRITEIA